MTKGRKTTFEERVEIVQYCIAHDRNGCPKQQKHATRCPIKQARNYIVRCCRERTMRGS